jgi:microcystin-dependent protein
MGNQCPVRRKQLASDAQMPVGVVLPFAGGTVPTGWLDCDGSAVSRTTYADLFAIIGTDYGPGDGTTTFNLPEFRSRSILGAGAPGGGLTTRARGDTGGAETHTLTTGEIPSHDHSLPGVDGVATIDGTTPVEGYDPTSPTFLAGTASATGSTGGGGAHNNVSPFGVTTMMIFANA